MSGKSHIFAAPKVQHLLCCAENSLKMKSLHNPFLIYGYVSPEYFCDREEETRELVSALRNGRNVTLMSPRRIGKSGLIHNAFHTLREEGAACFYVDVFATTSLCDFVRVFGQAVIGQLDTLSQRVMGKLRDIVRSAQLTFSTDLLTGAPTLSLSIQPQHTQAALHEIFAYLMQSDRECYIAFDEFQQITEYDDPSVEALLRTYVQQCPQLHFIFSGSKKHMMAEMFDNPQRPFYRSTQKFVLNVLPESVYYEFAARLMQNGGIKLSPEVFADIYQRFDGHTWYVQYILNRLYELAPAEVEVSDVTDCITSIVRTNAEDYQQLFHRLTRNQQQLLRAIATEGCVEAINAGSFLRSHGLKGTSSVNKALQSLLKDEYVYRYSEGYQIYDRFIALWLRATN